MVFQSLCRHTDILNSSFPFPPNFCFPPTPPPFPIEHLSLLTTVCHQALCSLQLFTGCYFFFFVARKLSSFNKYVHILWPSGLRKHVSDILNGAICRRLKYISSKSKGCRSEQYFERNTHRSFDWPTDVAMLVEADALEKLSSYIQS